MTYSQIGITGANGFIGSHLLRSAIARGYKPIALLQKGTSLEPLKDLEGKYEPLWGDLLDNESLDRFFSRCDAVIHLAGYNRYWAKNPRTFHDVNVIGARNVAEGALRHGVKKLIHASSCITLGASRDTTPRNEDSDYNLTELDFAYGKTKKEGQEYVKRLHQEKGLPVVVIHPTSAVGEEDFGPTPIGKPIGDIARGMWPVFVAGGACFIDVHDVVRGFWLALERAEPGSSYLLAGENLTNQEFMTRVAEYAGVGRPKFQVPRPVLSVVARAALFTSDYFTHKDPPLTPGMVGLIGKYLYFDGGRAEREIGFKAGPCGPAIDRCVKWFRGRN